MGGGAPLTVSLDPDFRVFAYALAISLITGFAFGLAPALRASKLDLTSALKEEGVSFGARMSRSRLRSLLVGSQVAASMMLLIAAGLLVRGLVRVPGVDTGFDTHSTFWLFFDAGPESTYWLCRWMEPASYAQYRATRNVPAWSASYRLSYAINGKSYPAW